MSTPRRRRLGAIGVALSVAVIATGPLPLHANASGTAPSVRLVSGTDKVTLKRSEGRRAYLDLSTYVAAVGGAFEIWAARPDYDHPVQVWQLVRQNGGHHQVPAATRRCAGLAGTRAVPPRDGDGRRGHRGGGSLLGVLSGYR